MTVAAKCNITGLVLELVGELYYGFKCKDNSYAIIENYLESLQCEDVVPEVCHPADCTNDPIIFNCQIGVAGIAVSINGNTVTFTSTIVGGTAPFTYEWSFETDDFTSGAINQSSLVLTLKPNKSLEDLVSEVSVTVTDANGCTTTKSCWLVDAAMKCNESFVPCPNPSQLTLLNATTYCVAPSNLIVN